MLLVFISLVSMTQSTLAQQGPTQCHDSQMTGWMLNSEGQNPCQVVQDLMRICNPSFDIDWLTPSYSCDNSPSSIVAACCCGSPTFALYSACWSCQYNYTMDVVTTTFTSFEKDCASVPTPLTSYDPIIKNLADQVDIPLWAKMEPSAGKWDLLAAWRNATPEAPTTTPPVPTAYPVSMNTLSSSSIIGIIVGSVFGTSLMFILAAIILWRCLGIGRYRQQDDDIQVGRNMGYLDGEYIYVRPETLQPNGTLAVGRRFTSRDPRRRVRPQTELDLEASDYDVSPIPSDYDNDTLGRPLRARSRSDVRSSYLGGRSLSYVEPPSPYSPAHHASLDGRYTGYHPGMSPRLSLEEPRYDIPRRISQERRSSRGEYDRGALGIYGIEYPETSRPVSGHFSNHRPRASLDHRDRPTSTHFVDRRPLSGQFPTSRSISGHFSDYRTSVERRQDHRVSVRSGLYHASFDLTRRSGDGVARFGRLEEVRRSRDGGRFSREEDGVGRIRDVYRKASLSEGEEDREDQGDVGESDEADAPRHSEASGSNFQQHLRKRSQSARTSCGWADENGDVSIKGRPDDASKSVDSPETPVPETPASPATTSNPQSAHMPTKSVRPHLRIMNPHSDLESRPVAGPTTPATPSIIREPSLLARARTLLSARSSGSGSSGHRNQESASGPPSAWTQRLPNVLRSRSRSRTGSIVPSRPGSSDSAHGSDVTSVYHTAHGHPSGSGTPATELGHRSRASAQASDEASYRQEIDAGIQLVVENPSNMAPPENGTSPPAYGEPSSSRLRPNPVSSSEDPNRLSTLTRDTGDWDGSTVSSGVIQTWTAARRPTGFVGIGRVLSSEQTPRSSHEAGMSMQNTSSTAVSTADEGEEEEHDKPVLGHGSVALDSHKEDGSRETAVGRGGGIL